MTTVRTSAPGHPCLSHRAKGIKAERGSMVTLEKRSVPFCDTRLEGLRIVYLGPNVIQRLRKGNFTKQVHTSYVYDLMYINFKNRQNQSVGLEVMRVVTFGWG